MKLLPITAAIGLTLALVGCKTMDATSVSSAVSTIGTAGKAMSLTDDEVVKLSNESCEAMDAQSKIAPANSKYTRRLNTVVKAFPKDINGKKAEYKVYLTEDVNAWAMANGCIRVYSGLMDLMNDDELRAVIGHEIGHVALGHSKSRMQTAYATSALRQVAAQSGNAAIATLSKSEAGALGEKFVNAQFSQSQESNADDYSYDLLKQLNLPRKGLVTSFQKLAKLSESKQSDSLLSSHPPSEKRASRMQERMDKDKSK